VRLLAEPFDAQHRAPGPASGRPIHCATSLSGMVPSQATSSGSHGRPALGVLVPRVLCASLIFCRVSSLWGVPVRPSRNGLDNVRQPGLAAFRRCERLPLLRVADLRVPGGLGFDGPGLARVIAGRRFVLPFGQGMGPSVKPTTSSSPWISQRTMWRTRMRGVRYFPRRRKRSGSTTVASSVHRAGGVDFGRAKEEGPGEPTASFLGRQAIHGGRAACRSGNRGRCRNSAPPSSCDSKIESANTLRRRPT
jgi:hypothetical protein